jgi:uncharacterized protein involved in exopolysaccharide biosynthesis
VETRPLTFVDYWRAVRRARWLLATLVVTTPLLAFLVGSMQPKVYMAKATMLVPREAGPQTLSMSLGAMLAGGGGGNGGGGGGLLSLPGVSTVLPSVTTSQDMIVALLKSRTLREDVLEEHAKLRGSEVRSKMISVDVSVRDKGVIGLAVEATDSKLAAELANGYFHHLDQLLEHQNILTTKRHEVFYASQLERAAKEVQLAEEAVMKFQTENRVLPIDHTTKREDSGMNLRATIMALELQREVLRMRVTEQHPQLRELEKQISELKRQYSRNLFGAPMDLPAEGPGARGGRKEFFVSAEKMTPVQFQFLKLLRNLKIQEAFYTAALQSLEQMKYGSSAGIVRVEVLDPAVVPLAPLRPNVPMIVITAAVAALVLGVFLALIVDYVERVRSAGAKRSAAPSPRKRLEDGLDYPRVPAREGARPLEPARAPAVPAGRLPIERD